MQLQQRINAFVKLRDYFSSFSTQPSEEQQKLLETAKAHNGWFTQNNILFAFQSWCDALSEENIKRWVSSYNFTNDHTPKTIAVIMAGNIPLVGFHDFISVLITGNKVLAKLSSSDRILLPQIANILIEFEPNFKEYIYFTEGKLEDFDAVIATGSNNTARYFDFYFGKYPNIIRKNRNGVAVLDGNETKEDMKALAQDVFQYFGLGCRNVSKVFFPKGYDKDLFFNGMYSWKDLINNDKYINNYDYNKAVYLMSNVSLLDNEFMLLKEDTGFSSPISVVFHETYNTVAALNHYISEHEDHIQCVVSKSGIKNEIPFGTAQHPQLWDYADGVDTVKFLLDLS